MYRGTPGHERFFRPVEAELAAMGGRPHWGKLHYRTAADLRGAYPRWDEFAAARDAVDPGAAVHQRLPADGAGFVSDRFVREAP